MKSQRSSQGAGTGAGHVPSTRNRVVVRPSTSASTPPPPVNETKIEVKLTISDKVKVPTPKYVGDVLKEMIFPSVSKEGKWEFRRAARKDLKHLEKVVLEGIPINFSSLEEISQGLEEAYASQTPIDINEFLWQRPDQVERYEHVKGYTWVMPLSDTEFMMAFGPLPLWYAENVKIKDPINFKVSSPEFGIPKPPIKATRMYCSP